MHDVLNIGESFVGSLLALVLWFHFDVDGWWAQKRIERGRRRELKENPQLRAEHDRQDRDMRRGR